jgi:hypothetical protein
MYYHIGQVINEYNSWENKFVDNLSRNIKLEFPDVVIVQEVLAQLPWYQNIAL